MPKQRLCDYQFKFCFDADNRDKHCARCELTVRELIILLMLPPSPYLED